MHRHDKNPRLQQVQALIKYTLDRVIAVLLAVLLGPVLMLIALAIKLDDRGSVFFRQDRLGLDAAPFRIWKFRTMLMDADRYLDASGSVTGNRVTRVGRFLRWSSLDELPQLFNIMKGEMAFIGPRPVIPAHLDRYTEEQKLRFRMKPGVTGLAQVNGRNTLKWSERIRLDNTYIDGYSLWLDVKILLRTIGVVFSGSGIVLDRNIEDVDDLNEPAGAIHRPHGDSHAAPAIPPCPVCSASSVDPRVSLLWPLFRCTECGHVFSSHTGGSENTHFEGLGYREWREANMRLLLKRARERMALAKQFVGQQKGRVFELGCSTGESLQLLAESGWESYGVDLSEAAVSMCKELHPDVHVAVGTEPSDIPEASTEPFDLVMAFHVIEHISDLATLASDIGRYCRKGGTLYICVPNWDSWCRRTMGDQWPDLMAEHVHYFTRSSIERWLTNSGFETVLVETGSAPWPWLGGMRRKFRKLRGVSSAAARPGMPGQLSMRILRAGEIVLWPLLTLERAFGVGNELRVIARNQATVDNTGDGRHS